MNRNLIVSFIGATAMFLTSCGSKSSSDDSVSANVRIAMISSGTTSSTGLVGESNKAVDFDQFANTTIASGSPDEMVITIKKMTLGNSTTNAVLPIFADATGKDISITGNRVDLSSLFTKISCVDKSGNAVTVPEGKTCKCGTNSKGELISANTDGSCPQLASGDSPSFGIMEVNQEGTFDKLTVEFVNKGTAKGCVTGRFSSVSKTYCTKKDQGLDASSSFASTSFEATTGTTQTVYWSKSGSSETSITKDFKMDSSITISATGDSPKLTMLIDRGRMLRFFNGSSSNSPGPSFPSSKAYFFSTVFEDSMFIYVGQAGDIKGYKYAAYAVKSQALGTTVPTSKACTSDCSYVNGWLTLILDTAGAPMIASLMPDDDNAFTILKGGNFDSTNPGKVLKSKLVVNSSTSWDIGYNLISSGKTTGLVGTISALDPTVAVGTSQTVTFNSSQSDTSNTTFTTWGEITLKRSL